MNILRLKVGVSILLSFLISAVLIRFVSFEGRPTFNTTLMQEEAIALQSSVRTAIAQSVPKFSFPSLTGIGVDFLAQKTSPPPNPEMQQIPNNPQVPSSVSNASSSFGFITQAPLPTSFSQPPVTIPTSGSASSHPPAPSVPLPTAAAPKPTAVPKPTKVPKPTAVPKLKLDARRPGSSFDEVVKIMSPIMCVPEAMMWATLENEYGPWLKNIEADWSNKNTMSGADTTAVSGSQSIIGVTQMMSDTWYRVKSNVMAKFTVDDMSLNVTFDSIAASAYHQRNVSLAGQDKQPCDDWDVKYILYAACRYNGACPSNTMGQTQYYNEYTYKVCEAYNRFTTGQKKNCR